MKHLIGIALISGFVLPAAAQRVLCLDSCRAMALRNNKQVAAAEIKQDMARNMRKSARTKYLPHVNAMGGYVYSSQRCQSSTESRKTPWEISEQIRRKA